MLLRRCWARNRPGEASSRRASAEPHLAGFAAAIAEDPREDFECEPRIRLRRNIALQGLSQAERNRSATSQRSIDLLPSRPGAPAWRRFHEAYLRAPNAPPSRRSSTSPNLRSPELALPYLRSSPGDLARRFTAQASGTRPSTSSASSTSIKEEPGQARRYLKEALQLRGEKRLARSARTLAKLAEADQLEGRLSGALSEDWKRPPSILRSRARVSPGIVPTVCMHRGARTPLAAGRLRSPPREAFGALPGESTTNAGIRQDQATVSHRAWGWRYTGDPGRGRQPLSKPSARQAVEFYGGTCDPTVAREDLRTSFFAERPGGVRPPHRPAPGARGESRWQPSRPRRKPGPAP